MAQPGSEGWAPTDLQNGPLPCMQTFHLYCKSLSPYVYTTSLVNTKWRTVWKQMFNAITVPMLTNSQLYQPGTQQFLVVIAFLSVHPTASHLLIIGVLTWRLSEHLYRQSEKLWLIREATGKNHCPHDRWTVTDKEAYKYGWRSLSGINFNETAHMNTIQHMVPA